MNRTADGSAARFFFCARRETFMHQTDRIPDEPTVDDAAALLYRAGWSAGDLATHTAAGMMWMVYADRWAHRIVIRADTQGAAWRLALDAARRLAD